MSSRALRRLQQDTTVIKVSGGAELSSEDGGEERPGRVKSKHKTGLTINPFAVVSGFSVTTEAAAIPDTCIDSLTVMTSRNTRVTEMVMQRRRQRKERGQVICHLPPVVTHSKLRLERNASARNPNSIQSTTRRPQIR